MNALNEITLVVLLKNWFEKSILKYDSLNFEDLQFFESIILTFKHDYLRYYPSDKDLYVEKINNTIPLHAILTYRIAKEFYQKGNEEAALLYSNLGRILSGIEIYYSSNIGEGLKINHGLGTVIGARCSIGKNALIHQNVTLGDKGGERPIIKDNVTIYTGAVIIGGITIGNNVIIGANSVVMKDVPDNKIVVGIPGKIL